LEFKPVQSVAAQFISIPIEDFDLARIPLRALFVGEAGRMHFDEWAPEASHPETLASFLYAFQQGGTTPIKLRASNSFHFPFIALFRADVMSQNLAERWQLHC
jgi:hypothetical protein